MDYFASETHDANINYGRITVSGLHFSEYHVLVGGMVRALAIAAEHARLAIDPFETRRACQPCSRSTYLHASVRRRLRWAGLLGALVGNWEELR